MLKRDRRHYRSQNTEIQSDVWLTTFSDLITLLLTFFILLYSFSAIDVERFQEVLSSLRLTFLGHTGIMEQASDAIIEDDLLQRGDFRNDLSEDLAKQDFLDAEQLAALRRTERLRKAYEEVKAFLQEAELGEDITLRLETRGVVMEMPDRIFFVSGRAELQAGALHVLDKMAEFFAEVPYMIVVEGHTDNVPINTYRFPSNWELSVARSVSVTRYLVEKKGLDPYRFVATGYGEYYPIATNETPEGRAQNRRVSFVLAVD
ncbi:MAG: OmpA/MotB family protein [Dethiobacteria bacterium]|jgi:chemotaxis protein MotB|nr:OmpA family protein [Bacillota bacterium]